MLTEPLHEAPLTSTKAISAGRPQDALLSKMDLSLRQIYNPLGYSVEIITNDPKILTAADDSFGHIRTARESTSLQIHIGVSYRPRAECPPEPTRREYNHLYSLVADAENQALLDLATGANFTWITNVTVRNKLYLRYNFLEKTVYLLLGASVVTDIHAACVSKHGKGILLCGQSGAGKSTLAYACARVGWSYTSDDTCYIINNSELTTVIGHCHRARFRPSARALFPELKSFSLTPRMEGKPSIEVPTDALPIQCTAPEAAIFCIVFLRRFSGATVNLVQLSRGTATHRLCGDLFSAGEIRSKHEKILERLWNIPTFDLQYDSLDEGIQALDLLSSETAIPSSDKNPFVETNRVSTGRER